MHRLYKDYIDFLGASIGYNMENSCIFGLQIMFFR